MGVKRDTFEKIVEILSQAEVLKKQREGRPNKFCIEDRFLTALEYLQEYRAYFHISTRAMGLVRVLVAVGSNVTRCLRIGIVTDASILV